MCVVSYSVCVARLPFVVVVQCVLSRVWIARVLHGLSDVCVVLYVICDCCCLCVGLFVGVVGRC